MTISDGVRMRRILWIAYVFPPAGGMQGLRMQRYLQEIALAHPDTTIDVLTIQQSQANPQFDPTLAGHLPAAVRVICVNPGILHLLRYRWHLDSRSTARHATAGAAIWLTLIRLSNLSWIPRAATWIIRSARRRYDAIYVFVDPFASVGLGLLAAGLNPAARLVLEFGDPRIPVRLGYQPLRRISARLERKALCRSAAAIFRTQAAISAYRTYYSGVPADRFTVLYGGVDWEPYDAAPDVPARPTVFSIAYTGTIYADSVDPAPFFMALARIVRSGAVIDVRIAGAPSRVITELVRDLDLDHVVRQVGHVDAKGVVAIQRTATLLLAFGCSSRYKISSKLAQYIAARTPILYVAESEAEPGAELVRQSRRGEVVRNEADAIEAAILDFRQAWECGELRDRFELSRSTEFSWQQLGGEVGSLLGGGRTTTCA
jgi:glycosyltransferase involved in cell wall biosynthesis